MIRNDWLFVKEGGVSSGSEVGTLAKGCDDMSVSSKRNAGLMIRHEVAPRYSKGRVGVYKER